MELGDQLIIFVLKDSGEVLYLEKIYLNEYDNISTLKEGIKEYIHFDNHKRFHESLAYKKPMEVHYESLKQNGEDYTKINESVA